MPKEISHSWVYIIIQLTIIVFFKKLVRNLKAQCLEVLKSKIVNLILSVYLEVSLVAFCEWNEWQVITVCVYKRLDHQSQNWNTRKTFSIFILWWPSRLLIAFHWYPSSVLVVFEDSTCLPVNKINFDWLRDKSTPLSNLFIKSYSSLPKTIV